MDETSPETTREEGPPPDMWQGRKTVNPETGTIEVEPPPDRDERMCGDPRCGHPLEQHNSVIVPRGCTAVDATSSDCVNGFVGARSWSGKPGDDRAGGEWKLEPGSVATDADLGYDPDQQQLRVYEVTIGSRDSHDLYSSRGPNMRFMLVAPDSKAATEEATRRWHEQVALSISVTERQPILVERLNKNVTRTSEVVSRSWWRRVFG